MEIDHVLQESQRTAIFDLMEEQVRSTTDFKPESEIIMVNPHIGTANAVQKDIREKGYTPKKGRLVQGALKRARHHREGDKSRGRKGY